MKVIVVRNYAQFEKILKEQLEDGTPNSLLLEIHPFAAEGILKKLNVQNRSKESGRSLKKISEYASDILADKWDIAQAILFVKITGYLLDGQHRLMACVVAKKPFRTFVQFNCDPCMQIDRGLARTAADNATIQTGQDYRKFSSAVHNVYRIVKKTASNPSDRIFREGYDGCRPYIEKAYELPGAKRKVASLSTAYMVCEWLIDTQRVEASEDDLHAIARFMVSGYQSDPRDIMLTRLRDAANKRKGAFDASSRSSLPIARAQTKEYLKFFVSYLMRRKTASLAPEQVDDILKDFYMDTFPQE